MTEGERIHRRAYQRAWYRKNVARVHGYYARRKAKERAIRDALRAAQPPATTRWCRRCHEEKPLAAFGVNRRARGGLHYYCRACVNAKAKEMSPKARAAKAVYGRRYQQQNRKAILARAAAYRRRKYAEDPEGVRRQRYTWRKSWEARNPERARAGEKRRRERVPREKRDQATRAWQVQHPDRMRFLSRRKELNRRARKRAVFVETVDPQVVFLRDYGICGICQQSVNPDDRWHIDHIVPLARGGVHAYANVQLAHAICNIRKGARAA